MTTWANIESGSKRNVNQPADGAKQSANRVSATASGTYASLYDNSAGTSSVVAHVITQNNAQFAISVGSPADDSRSYVVLANGKDAFVVPPGYKLWIRDLS